MWSRRTCAATGRATSRPGATTADAVRATSPPWSGRSVSRMRWSSGTTAAARSAGPSPRGTRAACAAWSCCRWPTRVRLRAGMTDPEPAPGVGLRVALPGAAPAGEPAHPRVATRSPSSCSGGPGPAGRGRRRRRGRRSVPAGRPHPPGRLLRDRVPRWTARSLLRPDGLRYAPRMRQPITARSCNCTASSTRACCPARRAARAGASPAPTSRRELPGVGHFPQEETPDAVSAAIVGLGPGLSDGPTRRGRCPPRRWAVLPARAASATCERGQRVAGVRIVDRRGEHDAEHAAVGREQRPAGVAGADDPVERVDLALAPSGCCGNPAH